MEINQQVKIRAAFVLWARSLVLMWVMRLRRKGDVTVCVGHFGELHCGKRVRPTYGKNNSEQLEPSLLAFPVNGFLFST
jgi:hypothetical protein